MSLATIQSLRPWHNRRLAEAVVEQLVACIRRGEFSPGMRLPSERALVQMFGVSRTVIREALVYMQQAGIVHTRQGAGTFVATGLGVPEAGRGVPGVGLGVAGADPSEGGDESGSTAAGVSAPMVPTDELRDLFELRVAIEGEAAALAACRSTEGDREQMLAALQRFHAEAADARLGVDADFEFHRAIVQASHNRYLVHALASVTEALMQSVFLSRIRSIAVEGRSELVQKEHVAVFDQIVAGNAVGAREAMRRHLDAAGVRLTGARPGQRPVNIASRADVGESMEAVTGEAAPEGTDSTRHTQA